MVRYDEVLENFVNVLSVPGASAFSYIMYFVNFVNFVTLYHGRLAVVFVVFCLCCRLRYGSEGIDTLHGRCSELLLDVVKCWTLLPLRRFIKWRAEVWSQRRQRSVSARDRPGARLASERVIWWNQELRILNGRVYGFFEEGDEPEGEEARRCRYRNSSLSEVSDPDEWMGYDHFEESQLKVTMEVQMNQGKQGSISGEMLEIKEDQVEQMIVEEKLHTLNLMVNLMNIRYHDLTVARESAVRSAMESHLDALDRGDVEEEIFYEN